MKLEPGTSDQEKSGEAEINADRAEPVACRVAEMLSRLLLARR